MYGPDRACIGGVVASWGEPSRKQEANECFWDEKIKQFTLGDFNSFTSFLEKYIGFKFPTISTEAEEIAEKPTGKTGKK